MKQKNQAKNKELVKKVNNAINFTEMKLELYKAGMTPDKVSGMLLDLCNFKSIKLDKNGDAHEYIDGKLRLSALELWCKITGNIAPTRSESKSMNAKVNLNELPDETLDLLICGNKK